MRSEIFGPRVKWIFSWKGKCPNSGHFPMKQYPDPPTNSLCIFLRIWSELLSWAPVVLSQMNFMFWAWRNLDGIDCCIRSLELGYQVLEIMSYQYLQVERRGNVFIITLKKPPENRLNIAACQELVKAYHSIQAELGPDKEGAVILTGNDKKFFTTVRLMWRGGVVGNCDGSNILQGLDLDEREGNMFSSSDGFYPVSWET